VLPPDAVQRAVRSAGFSPRGLRVEARGALRGSGDDLALDVGGGHILPVRGGAGLAALRELERTGRRDVILTGTLSQTGKEWQLAVGDARPETEARG
jgi:hypothetical protein